MIISSKTVFDVSTVHLHTCNIIYVIMIVINLLMYQYITIIIINTYSFINISSFLYLPLIQQYFIFYKGRDCAALKFVAHVFNDKSIKCKCLGNVAHFVSNVDLFFILFNNKLSTICPKLVRLGILVRGFARKHRSINQTGYGGEQRAFAKVTTKRFNAPCTNPTADTVENKRKWRYRRYRRTLYACVKAIRCRAWED